MNNKIFSIAAFIFFVLMGANLAFFSMYLLKNNKGAVSTLPKVTTYPKSDFSIENPPSDSLKGKTATMEGTIKWQSRTATTAAEIKNPITIQQGEALVTGADSKANVIFDNYLNLDLSEKSSVNVIQTLPLSFVFWQSSGSILYEKTGNIPISVRIKHLLVSIDGTVEISLDVKKPIVTLTQKSGETKIAFNNLKNVSQIITIPKGKSLSFNDSTRKAVVK